MSYKTSSVNRTILLLSTGSRGDCQPFIPLALALNSHGYRAVLGAAPNHQHFVESYKIKFFPVGTDTEEFLRWYREGTIETSDMTAEMYRKVNADAWALAQNIRPGVVLFQPGVDVGPYIAKKLGIPAIEVCFVPWYPTVSFPFLMSSSSWDNHETDEFGNYEEWVTNMEIIGAARNAFAQPTLEQMGETPVDHCIWWYKRQRKIPFLLAASPSVLQAKDWKEPQQFAPGYWFVDPSDNWKPSEDLENFLHGEPPIFVGFGSMFEDDPSKVFDAVMEAIQKTNQRFILQGFKEFVSTREIPKNAFVVGDVPHSWLFPRMKAAIVHGGAGTVAAVLRAGIPPIVIPHLGDQFFWANWLVKLGISPPPIPVSELTGPKLIDEIQQLITHPDMNQKAVQMGKRIKNEDSLGRILVLIDQMVYHPEQWVNEALQVKEKAPWLEEGRTAPSTESDWLWMQERHMCPFSKAQIQERFAKRKTDNNNAN